MGLISTTMKTDKQRMQDIQDRLISHIENELKDDDDYLYMATMLMKHSVLLYSMILEEQQVKKMLTHVRDNLMEDIDLEIHESSDGNTLH